MITSHHYSVEPWCVRESSLDLDLLAQSESVLALSNGHIGLRANLDEGEPHGLPGTYLNSLCELQPMTHAETGFGYPELSETIINVTNGKLIRLFVDDEPFDVRYGTLHSHERVLDMRAGTLTRVVHWTSPAGHSVRVSSERVVSLTQRAVAAIRYEVEVLDGPIRAVVQSELVTNEALPEARKDPRVASIIESPLVSEEHVIDGSRAVTVHRTRQSNLLVGAAMHHEIESSTKIMTEDESFPDVSRTTIACELETGERLRLVKYLAYGWSSRRSRPAVHDQVVAALAGAKMSGWDGLLAEQRVRFDEFWAGADVEVGGDPEVQQAVRYALVLGLPGERAGRAPPDCREGAHRSRLRRAHLLGHRDVRAAGADLHRAARRRRSTPMAVEHDAAGDRARSRARAPWRGVPVEDHTRAGGFGLLACRHRGVPRECRHQRCGDPVRRRDGRPGVRARGGAPDPRRDRAPVAQPRSSRRGGSLPHRRCHGARRVRRARGQQRVHEPDGRAEPPRRGRRRRALPRPRRRPRSNRGRGRVWRDAAAAMLIPYDERLGVHAQSESYTEHARWDFRRTRPDQYPLLLHFHYFDLYRKQVVKQADLVLAMHLRGDAFTAEQKARNFAYYEQLTVRDSSLSSGPQAVIAAEVGHLEVAHDYIAETALVDLRNLNENTSDGLHLASLASTWTGLVAGFGGMRVRDGTLSFAPRLPGTLTRLAFRMRFRGRLLAVTLTGESAVYELLGGDPLTVLHHGTPFDLSDEPTGLEIPKAPSYARPKQPPGREPAMRKAGIVEQQAM